MQASIISAATCLGSPAWMGPGALISLSVPGGGMFALAPERYHFALYFTLLIVSQQAFGSLQTALRHSVK